MDALGHPSPAKYKPKRPISGAGAFRQNQTKNSRSKEKLCSCCTKGENQGKNLRFSPNFISFFVLSSFPRSSYLCTILAPQPTISALNPFAPRFRLIKNSLFLYFSLYFYSFCFDFIQFLMSYPHSFIYK